MKKILVLLICIILTSCSTERFTSQPSIIVPETSSLIHLTEEKLQGIMDFVSMEQRHI